MKKGFTLVELLAVIVILLTIFLLVYPSVEKIVKKSKSVTYQSQINTILKGAYDYSLKNIDILPDSGKNYITLGLLKNDGFVSDNLINPNNKKLFKDSLVISINNVGGGYKYNNKNSMLKGDYLYTVEELNNINSPIITLTNLTKNNKGNYLVNINLNDDYALPSYIAKTYNNIDITDSVIINKYYNNHMVDDINTSKMGLYKINYIVVDNNGNSALTTLNLIIGDTEAPTIKFNGNITISKSIQSYNFMKDVTCTDNSEDCEISYTSDVEFGVSGKYIIEYTATDSNGNTSTKKRVLTIE